MPTESLELLSQLYRPEFPLASVKALTQAVLARNVWEGLGHGGYVAGWTGANQAGAFGVGAAPDDAEAHAAVCDCIVALGGVVPTVEEGLAGPPIFTLLQILAPLILEWIRQNRGEA